MPGPVISDCAGSKSAVIPCAHQHVGAQEEFGMRLVSPDLPHDGLDIGFELRGMSFQKSFMPKSTIARP